MYPTGGPPDTTPPKILSATPAPGTLHFDGNSFLLEFSEYVDKRSVEESIFLSPPLGKLEYDWSGTQVEIRFFDTLKGNTTYIMTIGTDVRDTKEKGNRMEESFALPFSTGDHIDSGVISGTVYDPEPEGIMVGAYKLDGRQRDSINPTESIPDFLTQTGKDGTFRLPYLSFGTYRLVAFKDEYKNLLYDRQVDKYGIYTRDIFLTRDTTAVQGVQFLLTKEDTSAPFLSSARAVDRNHFLLRFSERIQQSRVAQHSVTISDTLTQEVLDILDFSFVDTAGREAQVVTSDQESSKVYRIVVTDIYDKSNNLISRLSNSAISEGTSRRDTTKPIMTSSYIGDSLRNISVDRPIFFSWDEAIRINSFEHGFSLLDSSGGFCPGTFHWTHAASVSFFPDKPLLPHSWYAIRIVMDSLIDLTGNGYTDSVLVVHFKTVDESELSSISGKVVLSEAGPSGDIHLQMSEVSEGKKSAREAVLDSSGRFQFDNLPEGRYAFFLYEDRDTNGTYSFGMPVPFTFAERFTVIQDTLKLRARWPLEGVSIRFK
jgi:hypothetical protein